jgi:prepilin-type N-terminal cleavage/methylation domain-containing protein
MQNRRGMTLIEMLVALVIFTVVLAGALGGLRSQSRGFDRGSDEMSILQNMRFAADLLAQEIRTSGTNLAADQAPVVYAGANAFAFNADLTSNVANDLFAVYVDLDAPSGQVSTFLLANARPIPQSAPAFTYPLADYSGTMAETIIFFFEPDTSTTSGTDFRLMRQVNDQPAEVLVRNALPYPGRTFFKYLYENANRIDTVPTAWYPMSHSAAQFTGDETGVLGRINLLRATEVNFTVTNGRTGTALRSQQMSFIVSLPNTGIDKVQTCGAPPILGVPLVATSGGTAGAETIRLTWTAAADEVGGERDVLRYVIWRRPFGSATWGDPYRSIPAGNATYLFSDQAVTVGQTWEYQLAAQDCTPALSLGATDSELVVTGP